MLDIQTIEADETSGDLLDGTAQVYHAVYEKHLEKHTPWIKERLRTSVHDGKDLLRKAKNWYPHLVFCDKAKQQIEAIKRGAPQLPRLVDRLFELERSHAQWTGKGYNLEAWLRNVSHETKATLEHFGKQRMVVSSYGK